MTDMEIAVIAIVVIIVALLVAAGWSEWLDRKYGEDR